MRTIVVNTGTELLLGDVVNTHLTFIAREILSLGLRVEEQRTVPDGAAIASTLAEISPRAEIVFVTGGLGPTSDDITRELVAELLGLELREDPAVREAIHARLTARKIPMPERIWRQAQIPTGGKVLTNANGTAPGIYLAANLSPKVASPHLFLLPGPPRELQPMFHETVMPILRQLHQGAIAMRKFRLANVGESVVEEKVGAELTAIAQLEVGYCARPGEVDLRLIGPAAAVAEGERLVRAKLGAAIFTDSEEDLATVLVRMLSERNQTIAFAESCTGGFLANEMTNVPGASKVVRAGFVTYRNEAKAHILGVDPALLRQEGAVSEPVARAMAEGARRVAETDYALATTGIAGPGGATETKRVGTVFVSLASAGAATRSREFFLPTDRITFKRMVGQQAFDLLRRQLLR
ncbi:MAG: competence/damage-inducible protein A [Verrucomicrobiota bacterium]